VHHAGKDRELGRKHQRPLQTQGSARHVDPTFNLSALPRQAFTEVVLPGRSDKPGDLAPGTGAVQQAGKDKVAVYKDEDGTEHVFAAACPHLGCLVQWNPLDGTFGAHPLPCSLIRDVKVCPGRCTRLRDMRSVGKDIRFWSSEHSLHLECSLWCPGACR
jgi:hypothetical protein